MWQDEGEEHRHHNHQSGQWQEYGGNKREGGQTSDGPQLVIRRLMLKHELPGQVEGDQQADQRWTERERQAKSPV